MFVVVVIFSCNGYGQTLKVEVKSIRKDTVTLKIENLSSTDTILFSVYQQQLFCQKWITNYYDVYCNVTLAGKYTLFVAPSEVKVLDDIIMSNVVYSDELKKEMEKCNDVHNYRYVVKCVKEDYETEYATYYSNAFTYTFDNAVSLRKKIGRKKRVAKPHE